MQLIENEISKEINPLAKLKTKIEGRQFFLVQHHLYIKLIEDKKISTEEVEEYLTDVFDFLKVNPGDITDFIPTLKEVVLEKINRCKELKEACLKENQDAGICLAYVLLENELTIASFSKQIQKSKVSKEERIKTAFNDKELIKSFIAFLNPCLPKVYAELTRLISIKSKGQINHSKLTRTTSINFFENVSFNWHLILSDIRLEGSKVRPHLPKLVDDNPDILRYAEIAKNCKNFIEFDQANIPPEYKDSASMFVIFNMIFERIEANKLKSRKLLEENIEFFFSIYPRLQKLASKQKAITQVAKEYNKLKKDYLRTQHYILAEIACLQKTCHEQSSICLNLNDKNYQSELVGNLTSFLKKTASVENKLQELSKEWPENIPSNLNKISLIEQCNNFYNQAKELRSVLDVLSEEINSSRKQAQIEINQKELAKKLQEKSKVQERLKSNEEFFRLQEQKLRTYKKTVEEQKQEKQQLNTKIVETKKESDTQVTYQINATMRFILLNLSAAHFELLRSIVSYQKGIKYSDFYALFTNQLGGVISEIGNGSSHLRIELQTYMIEIITYTNKGFTKKSPNIVVGGMFRQHGEAHTNDKLCRFNLKLINFVLDKAGINLKTLAELEEMRAAEVYNVPNL